MAIHRRGLMLSAAAAAALPALARAQADEPVLVTIPKTRTAFEPGEVTITSGQTVRWRNRSIVEHSVVCDPTQPKDPANSALPDGAKPFDSGPFKDGATFEHRFETPGTYVYFCREHEGMGMVGKVIVTA